MLHLFSSAMQLTCLILLALRRSVFLELDQTAEVLLRKDTEVGTRPVRLMGISIGNLVTEEEPLQL
jgi:hypothetical protein